MGWVPIPGSTGGGTDDSKLQTVLADGIASWWALPRAVTYEGYIYTGGVSDSGVISVASTREIDDSFDLGTFESDDHLTPALLVPDDNPPFVAYVRHGQDATLRYRVGTDLGDLRTLGTEQTLTAARVSSYNQLWRTPGTDTIYLLYRDGARAASGTTWAFFKSTDWGSTFGSKTDLLNEDNAYIASVQVGSTIRCAVANHPDENTRDVWYFEVNLDSGDITKADGTVLANLDGTSLPLTTASLDVAFTASVGHGVRLMANSTRRDADGGPEIAVATWTTDTDTVYRHIDYDGGSWTATQITAAGVVFGHTASTHYNGGVAFFEPSDGGEVLISREASGTWYVERWILDGTWTNAEEYESSSTLKLFRPWPSVGGGFVYTRAETYVTYNNYTNPTIRAHSPEDVVVGDIVPLSGDVAVPGRSPRAAREDHVHGPTAVGGIDDLDDVDTSTVAPTDGQVLKWDNANSVWEPADDETGGATEGAGEILISDTPSTPLVFADLLQNEAQDDLVYSD